MKLLLASVFKPYGVDDAYGRKENRMELFYNQVTREQGIFSPRNFEPRSYGLYTIAENLSIPTVILDFPTLDEFVREVKKGYDYVGISFIAPNFSKARRMAQLVRRHSPRSVIILGGHGTRIPEIEKLIDCDHVVVGDGIRWLRRFLGEDESQPFKHPLLSGGHSSTMGVTSTTGSGLIVTGVGCPIGCRFCCTSDFFGRTYTPFLKTGREVYDVILAHERALNTRSFLVMDENFIKHTERANELHRLLVENKRMFSFNIFSSADAIMKFGIENMVSLGVGLVWIGVESKKEVFEKNKGVDIVAMVRALQDHGIAVLTSLILFLEHHTKANIHEDIDFAIGLRPDYIQFMQFSPMPSTPLFHDYQAQGRIWGDVPFEEWHGQHRIWFEHPEFTAAESEAMLREAFCREYEALGPSILRTYGTQLRGYRTLRKSANPRFRMRADYLAEVLRRNYPLLPAIASLVPTTRMREMAASAMAEYAQEFGQPGGAETLRSLVVQAKARLTQARWALLGDVTQPATLTTTYRM